MEPLNLTELARTAIAARYQDFERRGQHIELRGERCPVLGDRFALTTLIDNLLANANRHTPTGGEIQVSVTNTADGVCLEIADSGPGMPAAERARVFDRFYRIGGDRNRGGGSGLGLSIVKLIADLHGASIALGPSALGGGLAVRVDFPAHGPRSLQMPQRSAA